MKTATLEHYWLHGPPFEQCAQWEDNSREFVHTVCPLDPTHRAHQAKKGNLDVRSDRERRDPMIWTVYNECLVRTDVMHRMREQGFSGFQARDATVRFPGGVSEREQYKELVITGWGGRARPESGISLVRQCLGCGMPWYSRHTNPDQILDESQWDGSDLFMIWPLATYIMITGRVAQWLSTNNIQPCFQGDLTVTDPLIVKTKPMGSPGTLDCYLPRERALLLAPDLVGPFIPGPSRELGAWPPSSSLSSG